MEEIKPAASLSSSLLARKGQAKPATRPGFSQVDEKLLARKPDPGPDRIDVRTALSGTLAGRDTAEMPEHLNGGTLYDERLGEAYVAPPPVVQPPAPRTIAPQPTHQNAPQPAPQTAPQPRPHALKDFPLGPGETEKKVQAATDKPKKQMALQQPSDAELVAEQELSVDASAPAEKVMVESPVAVLHDRIEAAAETLAVRHTKPKKRAEPGSRGKAAFTLRLEGERHRKLRLLSAHLNRSSQKIVVEALDQYFASVADDLFSEKSVRRAFAKS